MPGDKSISHRALLFGAIADGVTTIEGLLPAEDPISTAACLRAMGAEISPIGEGDLIRVTGVGLDGLQEPDTVLDCGNSGTTMRLMLGLLAGRDGRHFVLTGDASLRRRPMQRVGQPLAMLGALAFLAVRSIDLNIYAQVGLVTLIGLAAKNGILIVEVAEQHLAEGMSASDAVIASAESRLRPILMTAIAALAGFLPLVVANGAGAQSQQSLGTVIFGGLVVATVLSLGVVPPFYVVIKGLEERLFGRKPTGGDEDGSLANAS